MRIKMETPCQEQWEQMTAVTDACKFCASCQKEVIDFTNKSDQEIARIIEKTPHLCGRFTKEQLDKDYRTNKTSLLPKVAWASALASFLAINPAQGNEHESLHDAKVITAYPLIDDGLQTKHTEQVNDSTQVIRVIKGVVKDSVNGEGMFGATVTIKGTKIGATTDFDGNYKFRTTMQGELTIQYSFVGYFTQEIVVGQDEDVKTVNTTLVGDPNAALDMVVVGGIGPHYRFPSPKWFWHKIKRFPRWVTSPFRKK